MDGLLLINKPRDITSFGVVATIRRALGGVKCGHAGTLDPMAEGLLPVLVGRGTKLSQYLLEGDKQYIATLQFGIATDTYDITGNVTGRQACALKREQVERVIRQFVGNITQVPPAFSAIKQNGVPLYKKARSGEAVVVPERTITVYDIELLSFDNDLQQAKLRIDCSKGTYIRSLCVDIAKALGSCGTMAALQRTKTLGFSLQEALPLEMAAEMLTKGDVSPVLPLTQAVSLPLWQPEEFFATLLSNGCAVETKKLGKIPATRCWVLGRAQQPLGIGEIRQDGTFKIITHI